MKNEKPFFDKDIFPIEDMTAAFIHFCVKPDNLPLVEAFLTEANGTEARELINQQIFQAVLEIALEQRS